MRPVRSPRPLTKAQEPHELMKTIFIPSLAALVIGSAVADKTVTSQTLCCATASWDGTCLPAYGTGQPEITIKRITIPPGTSLPMHKHPVINAGVLLRGTLAVETEEGKKLVLKAGDPIIEVVDHWHRGTNVGAEPAEIIVFYAGTVGDPLTVKKKPKK